MNINVSEKTELKIREIAKLRGQEVADVAGSLLDEKVRDIDVRPAGRRKLSDFAGVFYGGDGQTAENASEILRSEIDKRSGFGK